MFIDAEREMVTGRTQNRLEPEAAEDRGCLPGLAGHTRLVAGSLATGDRR
jgi:hypothetical protein